MREERRESRVYAKSGISGYVHRVRNFVSRESNLTGKIIRECSQPSCSCVGDIGGDVLAPRRHERTTTTTTTTTTTHLMRDDTPPVFAETLRSSRSSLFLSASFGVRFSLQKTRSPYLFKTYTLLKQLEP